MRSIGAGGSVWVFLAGIGVAAQCAVGCGSSHHHDDETGGGGFAEAGAWSESSGGAPVEEAGAGPVVGQGGSVLGGASSLGGFGPGMGGHDPGSSFGGRNGVGGNPFNNVGGSGVGGAPFGSGGRFGVGGTTFATGGTTAACVDGAPCTCKKLTGVTVCDQDGNGSCDCPAAAECAPPAVEPCFDPCGGDPFGTWVLEDECFSGSAGDVSNCLPAEEGVPKGSTLRILFDDGGYYQVVGTERWAMHTRFNPGCYGAKTVNQCDQLHPALDMLLFSYDAVGQCQADACGVCDCQTDVEGGNQWTNGTWTRQAQQLTIDSNSVPYCVKDDVMWLGGVGNSGIAQVSYKFRRKSCVGAPVACSGRTKEQCAASPQCVLGACTTSSGAHSARCDQGGSEQSCSVLAGCEWQPDSCAGEVATTCTIDTCDSELGCSWSDPSPHCSGTPYPCSQLDPNSCTLVGCGLEPVCSPASDIDSASCSSLSVALCTSAPGCSVVNNRCTGTTHCSEQTGMTACAYLGCSYYQVCSGVAKACAGLSVGDCKQNPGCVWSW